MAHGEMNGGVEWIVDAVGLAPDRISHERGLAALQAVFAELVERLDLHPLGPAQWHTFEGTGGLTGLVALSESHLACHTYPEAGALTLNLYTCRARPAPDWSEVLTRHLGRAEVDVRCVARGLREQATKGQAT